MKKKQHKRKNFTLSAEADRILTLASKRGDINKSKLLSNLIIQKLTDPIEHLKSEKRELIIKINEIDEKIKHYTWQSEGDKNVSNS